MVLTKMQGLYDADILPVLKIAAHSRNLETVCKCQGVRALIDMYPASTPLPNGEVSLASDRRIPNQI